MLLLAYGAPDSLENTEPFYTHICGGHKPAPALLQNLTGRYEAIGGKSPLLEITRQQASALHKKTGIPVYVGMRHWKPWIEDSLEQMAADGIEEIIAIVMAPHYSALSIGKYFEAVDEALIKKNLSLKIIKVKSWGNHPLFIKALTERIKESLKKFNDKEQADLHVVFTAHSLPERIIQDGDPYMHQLMETSGLVALDSGIKSWEFAFQSAGRTSEPWLGPDISEALERLTRENRRSVLICVAGFLSDHLEVLYDIDIEAADIAKKSGIHLERIEMLNDSPLLTAVLDDLVKAAFI